LFSLWQGAVKAEATCKAEHKSYVAQQQELGADAQRKAEEKDRDNQIVLAKQARVVNKLTERAVFAERKLRERPPVRPDGSTVSSTACNSGGVSGPAGEFVSLEDYRQLELRSYRDTDKCNALQETIRDLAAKGLVLIQ